MLSGPRSSTYFLSRFVPVPIPRSPVVLLPLPMLCQTPLYLASIALKTFKQTLLNKFLHRRSTSPTEPLYLFLHLNLLLDKTYRKQIFDTAFINSCPFNGNHTREEIDISFVKYGCLATVKLN